MIIKTFDEVNKMNNPAAYLEDIINEAIEQVTSNESPGHLKPFSEVSAVVWDFLAFNMEGFPDGVIEACYNTAYDLITADRVPARVIPGGYCGDADFSILLDDLQSYGGMYYTHGEPLGCEPYGLKEVRDFLEWFNLDGGRAEWEAVRNGERINGEKYRDFFEYISQGMGKYYTFAPVVYDIAKKDHTGTSADNRRKK